jgi:hypothetical protein
MVREPSVDVEDQTRCPIVIIAIENLAMLNMKSKISTTKKNNKRKQKKERKDMLKKYGGKLDDSKTEHLKEGVDYLDDIQRNKKKKYNPLSPEEEQIVRMPWLKEHIK